MEPLEPEQTLARLRRHESRNITWMAEDGMWPVVWEKARGCRVTDVAGREYLDLTAAFGVAAAGHANPRVVKAGRQQMGRLLHGMGDVHPHRPKAALVSALSDCTWGRWIPGGTAKVILTGSGSEAVEAAMKTARLATGRAGLIAFEGAYHGLGYGALNATHREHFRERFRDQLAGVAEFIPFPSCETCACPGRGGSGCEILDGMEAEMDARRDAMARDRAVGAVLVEPVQARGGIRVPPRGFLKRLREWCDRNGALLILDEIYTGFGRTGHWFACEEEGVVPDVICLGKAMTGGFPMGACVGRADLMDAAWPVSDGEAIHTSTFLGHPVGCAMALAQLEEIERLGLVKRAGELGVWLRGELERWATRPGKLRLRAVGRGLMAGWEVRWPDGRMAGGVVVGAMQRLAGKGILVLPEGADAEVMSLTPPLTVGRRELGRAIGTIWETMQEVAG